MNNVVLGDNIKESQGNLVWRYMCLERFIDLLATKQLFFTPLKEYQKTDPFEGLQPEVCLSGLHKFKQDHMNDFPSNPRFKEMFIDKVKGVKVNCWHMNDYESEAMWKLYAHNGVCISTTVSRLVEAINIGGHKKEIKMGKVKYLDLHDHKLQPDDYNVNGDLFSPLIKRKSYAHENEMRLFIEHELGAPIESERVNVNILKLVQHIYISPYAGDMFSRCVEAVCEKFIPEIRDVVVKSRLLDGYDQYLTVFD